MKSPKPSFTPPAKSEYMAALSISLLILHITNCQRIIQIYIKYQQDLLIRTFYFQNWYHSCIRWWRKKSCETRWFRNITPINSSYNEIFFYIPSLLYIKMQYIQTQIFVTRFVGGVSPFGCHVIFNKTSKYNSIKLANRGDKNDVTCRWWCFICQLETHTQQNIPLPSQFSYRILTKAGLKSSLCIITEHFTKVRNQHI